MEMNISKSAATLTTTMGDSIHHSGAKHKNAFVSYLDGVLLIGTRRKACLQKDVRGEQNSVGPHFSIEMACARENSSGPLDCYSALRRLASATSQFDGLDHFLERA